ncbi:MAG: hypothetical protein JOZ10_18920 [Acidobacteria bacterium]|nr:hypothetical protein [Acidobacteriota bacterium]MBV9148176.1 hypothetical protein [Acidobacteriota bacterium]MBV9437132.1 hypothetical protein [Acidobacteriota bacterium]
MCANVALMQSGEGTQSSPQFETAEFPSAQGGNVCFVCHQPVSGTYYRVNSRMACAACTERLRNSLPKDSHAAFVRAVLFGAAAAIAGLALYAMVGIVTGLMIGYVSLAVGWLVGKAMMKGSGGLGGRRYQIVAVLFTYAAVSMAAIPIGIAEYMKEKKPQQGIARGQGTSTPGEGGQPEAGQGAADSQRPADSSDQNVRLARKPSIASAMGYLALMGLASPFMELASDSFHGLIGLVILLVGVRIAWQLTRGRPPLVVDGPF